MGDGREQPVKGSAFYFSVNSVLASAHPKAPIPYQTGLLDTTVEEEVRHLPARGCFSLA